MKHVEKHPNENMRDRVQIYLDTLGRWAKYDVNTGAVMQVKHDGKPFARVQRLSTDSIVATADRAGRDL